MCRQLVCQHQAAELRDDVLLHVALDGARAHAAVRRGVQHIRACGVGGGEQHVAVGQARVDGGQLRAHDSGQVVGPERVEHHNVVQAVHHLWREELVDGGHDGRLGLGAGDRAVQERLGSEIGGHDDGSVLEIDGAALGVCQPAVVQHLQQHVEHARMRLLDLVQEDDAVRPPAHRLRELPALIVAHVAGWRAHEPRHAVLLHVLAHVQPHHVPLVVEELCGERLGELGLAHAGGAQEQEGAGWLPWAAETCTGALDCGRHRCHRRSLPQNAAAQRLRQRQQLGARGLAELGHWDAGPAADDLVHVLRRHRLAQHAATRRRAGLRRGQRLVQPLLQLRDHDVPQVLRAHGVALTLRCLQPGALVHEAGV
mmetsp:Transcript_388/g.857  ORF Transcript_388/g.857 Transcript_388/m.857 type:complete len:369 (-) Transcript_388:28-1134(-)